MSLGSGSISLGSVPINLVHSTPTDLPYEQERKRWNYL